MLVEAMLEDLGCVSIGVARTVPDAVASVETLEFDLALLDVNLAGQRVFPVAEALMAKGLPFIFSSGYGANAIPEEFRGAPLIPKPFTLEELEAAIAAALGDQIPA